MRFRTNPWSRVETNDSDINLIMPSEAEFSDVVRSLKNGTAPGICKMTREMFQESKECLLHWLTQVTQGAWQTEKSHRTGEQELGSCFTGNHRGITTVLSVPRKVFARIVLWHLRNLLLKHRRQEQIGLTLGRSKTDRISP